MAVHETDEQNDVLRGTAIAIVLKLHVLVSGVYRLTADIAHTLMYGKQLRLHVQSTYLN